MTLTAALHESEGRVVQYSVSGGSGVSACRNSDVELVEGVCRLSENGGGGDVECSWQW